MLAFLLYHRFGRAVLLAAAIVVLAVFAYGQAVTIHPLIWAVAFLAAVRRPSRELIRT